MPPALFPLEYQTGQCRKPTGAANDMQRCLPAIAEYLAPERKAAGRVGHFNSRNPLLGLTPEQEGSMPDTFSRSTTPAPGAISMPRGIANRRPDQIVNADPVLREKSWLYMPAMHLAEADRLWQDRGNYLNQRDARDIGGKEVTVKQMWKGDPVRVAITNNTQFEMFHGGAPTDQHQAGATYAGKEIVRQQRKGGEQVNSRGWAPGRALTDHRIGLGTYEGRAPYGVGACCVPNILASQPFSLLPDTTDEHAFDQSLVDAEWGYDPANVDASNYNRPESRKIALFQVHAYDKWLVDGAPVWGDLTDSKPTDYQHDTGVYRGPDLNLGQSVVDTSQITARPEQKSGTALVNFTSNPKRFEAPYSKIERPVRAVDNRQGAMLGRPDVGIYQTNTRRNEPMTDASFYTKRQIGSLMPRLA